MKSINKIAQDIGVNQVTLRRRVKQAGIEPDAYERLNKRGSLAAVYGSQKQDEIRKLMVVNPLGSKQGRPKKERKNG